MDWQAITAVGGVVIGALSLYRAGVANEHASRAARQAEVANELARSAIETSGNANTLSEEANKIALASEHHAKDSAEAAKESSETALHALYLQRQSFTLQAEDQRSRELAASESRQARLIFLGVKYENRGELEGVLTYRLRNDGQATASDLRFSYGAKLAVREDNLIRKPIALVSEEVEQWMEASFDIEGTHGAIPRDVIVDYEDGKGSHKARLSLRLARDFSSRSTSWTARSFIDGVQVTAAESGDGTREVWP